MLGSHGTAPETLDEAQGHGDEPRRLSVRFELARGQSFRQYVGVDPIARKVVQLLRKAAKPNVVALASFREAKRWVAAEGLSEARDEALGELPASQGYWLSVLKTLTPVAWPLLDLAPLSKLRDRIDDTEERYMPGGPPQSPLTDSFHVQWCLADATIGSRGESLASILVTVGRVRGWSKPLLDECERLAASTTGVYVIESHEESAIRMRDLVTAESRLVDRAWETDSEPGTVWWTRLLPPPSAAPELPWTSVGTPYVFTYPGAEALWRDYFSRHLPMDAPPAKRNEAYRRLMRHGEHPDAWFEFILDGYNGVLGDAIEMVGVPDQLDTLPHAEGHEESLSALERVRRRLLAIAQKTGATAIARRRFLSERESVGLDTTDWDFYSKALMQSCALLGAPGTQGRTALEVLADSADELDEEERATLLALQEGWFSIFEITRIKVDEGFEVRDRLRRKRLFIRERMATRQVCLGDLLCGWILKHEDDVTFEGGICLVPGWTATPMVDLTQELLADLRKDRRLTWRERLDGLTPFVAALSEKLRQHRPAIQLCNHDGEEVVNAEALYTLRGSDAHARLLAIPNVEQFDEGEFAWLDPEKDVVVARFLVDSRTLRIEANSRGRLLRARTLVDTAFGDRITHRADSFSDPLATPLQDGNADRKPAAPFPPDAEEAIAAALMEKLLSWCDQPVPMLEGKTPRQAVRSKRGRDDVAALLLDQERSLRASPLAHLIDFGALWREVRLPYPG